MNRPKEIGLKFRQLFYVIGIIGVYELSMFAICDGKDYILLPAAQDHKRLMDNDQGPNTGGMGAYAPTPLVDDVIYQKVKERVIRPTLDGMARELD